MMLLKSKSHKGQADNDNHEVTVKGKGIPEIENQVGWHGKAPSEEECERFIKVLEAE